MKTLLFTFLLISSACLAQISHGGMPYSFSMNQNVEVDRILMPEIDLLKLEKEDSLDALRGLPMRFGKAHDVNISSKEHGKWFISPKGVKIWRLDIQCPEALSVNLLYEKFDLPAGGKFFIYDSKGEYVLGAFTNENNKGPDEFATGLIPGDIIRLEYNAPAESRDPQILINRVVHGYKNFFEFGDSGPCNNNVNCPEGAPWSDQKNSVAMIVLAGGSRWCSGAMINNTCEDGSPYFLTANHCLTGSGVGSWMFYFNYQSPNCNNIDGPTNQIVSGAKLLSTSAQSDFALLELDSRPPAAYNVYYSGWSNLNIPTDTAVSIHHPSGDIKKISFANQPTQSTAYLQSSIDTNLTHWRIPSWDDGTTEGGSSGSPLYNTDKQIVGQLHGGYAACSNNSSDWYGKFSYSWNNGGSSASRLADWLDPAQIGLDTMNGNYFNSIPLLEASIAEITDPLNNSCDRIQLIQARINNKGIDTINSMQIAFDIPGIVDDTLNWSGTLNPGESQIISLDTIIFSGGNYVLNTELLSVNNTSDNNFCNNQRFLPFSVIEGNYVTIKIRTDNWPEETKIEISDTSGNVLYEVSEFTANTLDSFSFCLSPDCYDITIYDSWGDGLTGGAYYQIEYKDSTLFSGSGAFGNCTGSQMPNGCFVTHRLCMDSSLFQQLPIARFTISDTLFRIGDTISLKDISENFPQTWDWTVRGDSSVNNFSNQDPFLIASIEGYYDVKLKVSNIFGEDSIEITNAFRVEKNNSIPGISISDKYRIYPNPAKEILNIDSDFDERTKLEIANLSGSVQIMGDVEAGRNRIDIKGLKPGIYLLRLIGEDSAFIEKIIIQ